MFSYYLLMGIGAAMITIAIVVRIYFHRKHAAEDDESDDWYGI